MKLVVNLLTSSRVFLAGGAAFFLQSSLPWKYQWFAGLILIAGITDAIDGPIARRFGVATDGGGRLDHGVDAVFVGVLLAGMFSLLGRETCIVLVILQVLTAIIALVQVLSRAEEVWPNNYGKWSVIALVVAILLLAGFKGTKIENATSIAGSIFVGIAILLRLQSFWVYWQWLEKKDFLWKEESAGGEHVGKDPA